MSNENMDNEMGNWRPKTMNTPQSLVRALQYLYYTGDGNNRLGGSPVSDRAYDLFCESHNIQGNGGSDLERDYSKEEIELAEKFSKKLIQL